MTDDGVGAYIDAIDPAFRPVFDRLHALIVGEFPDTDVVLSYKIPTYRRAGHRLFLGVWRHGVSIYGWGNNRDAGFTDRHPDLRTGRGTIQLRPADAAAIDDDEFRHLIRAALDE